MNSIANYKKPSSFIATGQKYLAAIAFSFVLSCSIHQPRTPVWSYVHPPAPGAAAVLPVGGVWCDDFAKAVFMATTGFFAIGCSSKLDLRQFIVVEVEHIAQNDVRSWVVKIRDSGHQYLWIPLPDHNWA